MGGGDTHGFDFKADSLDKESILATIEHVTGISTRAGGFELEI